MFFAMNHNMKSYWRQSSKGEAFHETHSSFFSCLVECLAPTFLILIVAMFCAGNPLHAIEGYYKDIFMDGGVSLTSRTSLSAAESLGLTLEYLATSDEAIQTDLMIGTGYDTNGVLLYPDGQPRFRLIQTNGGSATGHGNSLDSIGRERVRTFFNNGGCYTGCCAGAFISSISYEATGIWEAYYHIWLGRTRSTGLASTYTGHFITDDSPLLDYSDFGGDMYVASIYHNGGCYAREDIDFPPETEILLRYDYSSMGMHEKASCWAYKDSDTSGRLVVIGSHPEGVGSGERLYLMEAMLQYAMAGQGNPAVKCTLAYGVTRYMDKSTGDDDPAYTKIGDKQYHHFILYFPEAVHNFRVTIDGEDAYHLNIFAKHEDYAFQSSADYFDISPTADKTLYVPELSAGTWYIGVECADTIETIEHSWGYEYTGAIDVLNGIAYAIIAGWDTTTILVHDDSPIANFDLSQNYPNPFNRETVIPFDMSEPGPVRIVIYDSKGQSVKTLVDERRNAGEHSIVWNCTENNGDVVPAGIYIIRMKTAEFSAIKKALLIK